MFFAPGGRPVQMATLGGQHVAQSARVREAFDDLTVATSEGRATAAVRTADDQLTHASIAHRWVIRLLAKPRRARTFMQHHTTGLETNAPRYR